MTNRLRFARFSVALCCGLLALHNTGCQSGPERRAEIERTKQLKIATDATYPPFEYMDSARGGMTGLDIDLSRIVWGRLGYEIEFVVVPFDGIMSGLIQGRYDAVISAFTITPERSEQILFSKAYYDAGQVLAIPSSDTTVESLADLAGCRIGVQRGSTAETLAKQEMEVEVFSYDRIEDAFMEMASGNLEAVLNDRPTSEFYIANHEGAKLTGKTLSREQYAVAFRKSDAWLRDLFNSALTPFLESGELDSLRGIYIQSANPAESAEKSEPNP